MKKKTKQQKRRRKTPRPGLKRSQVHNYADYLKSHHWQVIREQALKRVGCRCEDCETTEGVRVYHREYHWFSERPSDLEVLCNDCHGLRHEDQYLMATGINRRYQQVMATV